MGGSKTDPPKAADRLRIVDQCHVELVAGQCRSIVVGGTRAGDMAVRLKYAGVPQDRIWLAETIAGGLDTGLSAVVDGGTLFVLPTYTAMLELRQVIGRRGYASHFWEQ